MSAAGPMRLGRAPVASVERLGYSTSRLAQLAGASRRQIDAWARLGYLRPSIEAEGTGSRRVFPRSEALIASVLVLVSTSSTVNHHRTAALVPPHRVAEVMRTVTPEAAEVRFAVRGGVSLVVDLNAIRAQLRSRRT